jgi:hypothetical protein
MSKIAKNRLSLYQTAASKGTLLHLGHARSGGNFSVLSVVRLDGHSP